MVPVLDKDKTPLMPCSEKRAKKLMESGRAKPFWNKGVFCIILQDEPKSRYKQDIVVGIDPGSKWEGLTVKSEAHTLLNIQTEAKTDVREKVEMRKILRRSRRLRNLRYRKPRRNRRQNKRFLPPSTKARWDYKISLINWLRKLYNITSVGVEDVMARTWKGARKWNEHFSAVTVGKNYFRDWVMAQHLALFEYTGWETSELRKQRGLKKNSKKSKKDFYTHCVDSWVIANAIIGGHIEVDNKRTVFLSPLKRYRRQLHVQNFAKGGKRKNYGGTRSLGVERGTLVRHLKCGLTLVGGTSKGRVSLHSFATNKRLYKSAGVEDLKILTNVKWKFAESGAHSSPA